MSDLRADLRALITEYGRDGGNDDIDDVLDRAITLLQPEPGSVLLTRDEAALCAAALDLQSSQRVVSMPDDRKRWTLQERLEAAS